MRQCGAMALMPTMATPPPALSNDGCQEANTPPSCALHKHARHTAVSTPSPNPSNPSSFSANSLASTLSERTSSTQSARSAGPSASPCAFKARTSALRLSKGSWLPFAEPSLPAPPYVAARTRKASAICEGFEEIVEVDVGCAACRHFLQWWRVSTLRNGRAHGSALAKGQRAGLQPIAPHLDHVIYFSIGRVVADGAHEVGQLGCRNATRYPALFHSILPLRTQLSVAKVVGHLRVEGSLASSVEHPLEGHCAGPPCCGGSIQR
eukprot:scaffold15799_cov28-Tisochrysis_lutea.AAC.1